jgi:hypothetical protein
MSVRLRGLTAEQIVEDLVLQRQILQERLQCKLVDYQRKASTEIFRLVAAGGNQELPLLWARRVGKTEMLVDTALTVGVYWIHRLNLDFDVGLINPARNEQSVMVTRERLRERVAELRAYLELTYGIRTELGDGRKTPDFVFIDSTGCECRIRALSADPSAHVKGAGFNLMFLEQVEEMDEQVMKTIIFPMAAGQELESTQVLAGTPSLEVENHYFHERSRELRYPRLVDDKAAGQFRPSYAAWVAMEKERLGEDSDEYRTQYGCQWIQVRNRLITRDALLLLGMNWAPNPQNARFAGTDVAKLVDRTICTMYERSGADLIIIDWLELEGTDYEDQADDIAAFTAGYNARVNVVDLRGPGIVLADMLRRRGKTKVEGFQGTPQSNNELYTIYERELTHKRVKYLAYQGGEPATLTRCRNRFIEEHQDVERHFTGNLLKLEAPQKKGYHDDYVSSGALGVFGSVKNLGGIEFGLHVAVRQ